MWLRGQYNQLYQTNMTIIIPILLTNIVPRIGSQTLDRQLTVVTPTLALVHRLSRGQPVVAGAAGGHHHREWVADLNRELK